MAVVDAPAWAYRYFPVREFISRASYAGAGVAGNWSSFYRDPAHNQRVGGDPWSQHLVGLAADHKPASAAFRMRAREAGLIVVNEGDHDHVQGWRAGTLRRLFA